MSDLFDFMRGITRPPRRPVVGKYSRQLDIDGVLVDVTYDVEGWNTPATELDPAEVDYVVVQTARVGTADVMPWADRLGLEDAVYGAIRG